MEAAVVWAVVWGVLAFISSGVVGALIFTVFGLIVTSIDKEELAPIGVLLGWFAGAAWFVICAVYCVQSILTAVSLS